MTSQGFGKTLGLALVLLAVGARASAFTTNADKCQAAKIKAAGKFGFCRAVAEKKGILTGLPPDYGKCSTKLATKWSNAESQFGASCPTSGDQVEIEKVVTGDASGIASRLSPVPASGFYHTYPATGETVSSVANDDGAIEAGAPLEYVDNDDGTITDLNTGLMWEKKIKLDSTPDAADLHDADDCYPWAGTCSGDGLTPCGTDADCTVATGTCQAGDCQSGFPSGLTVFQWVAQLNSAGFAGHNDWRVPNVKELQSLLDYGSSSPGVSVAFAGGSCGTTCTDLTDPGCSCTGSNGYWSSTTVAISSQFAWGVYFGLGVVDFGLKTFDQSVRAVRGGS